MIHIKIIGSHTGIKHPIFQHCGVICYSHRSVIDRCDGKSDCSEITNSTWINTEVNCCNRSAKIRRWGIGKVPVIEHAQGTR